ncbi:hypothetical protein [Amycolatopsis sp. TNS106]|uniref:hypothetical protein n=1 Tax=Amycolatopsis sp. TNS106 TaxID=2861750 RepID=UPI001C74637A|nr:hypothetical protein [Amycolatopsis sp. TNS106]QXV57352.1 hypothetical protein CVV72_10230 [Amycolatopsis sp. TNS106]
MTRKPRRGDSLVPEWIEPMLAKPDRGRLPADANWSYEYKLDGYRTSMQIAPDGTTLLTCRPTSPQLGTRVWSRSTAARLHAGQANRRLAQAPQDPHD